MRLNKNESAKVSIHKNRQHIASFYNSFDNLEQIKGFVRAKFENFGIVEVSVLQDGGFYTSFNVKTNTKNIIGYTPRTKVPNYVSRMAAALAAGKSNGGKVTALHRWHPNKFKGMNGVLNY